MALSIRTASKKDRPRPSAEARPVSRRTASRSGATARVERLPLPFGCAYQSTPTCQSASSEAWSARRRNRDGLDRRQRRSRHRPHESRFRRSDTKTSLHLRCPSIQCARSARSRPSALVVLRRSIPLASGATSESCLCQVPGFGRARLRCCWMSRSVVSSPGVTRPKCRVQGSAGHAGLKSRPCLSSRAHLGFQWLVSARSWR